MTALGMRICEGWRLEQTLPVEGFQRESRVGHVSLAYNTLFFFSFPSYFMRATFNISSSVSVLPLQYTSIQTNFIFSFFLYFFFHFFFLYFFFNFFFFEGLSFLKYFANRQKH
ncbi:hypothetical protein RND81_10G098000 [Saponaria officinalis]|uniref:Uncharacterized protein n=1 Tax=Saponaria officinalis TaxID=3572 RepID=A0AAW1I1E8_SAPOF